MNNEIGKIIEQVATDITNRCNTNGHGTTKRN